MPIALAPLIGILLLVLAAVYVFQRTSVLGAILLTGYFGGAAAVNMRAAFPPFETIFPILFGCLVWAPPYILNERLRALVPLT